MDVVLEVSGKSERRFVDAIMASDLPEIRHTVNRLRRYLMTREERLVPNRKLFIEMLERMCVRADLPQELLESMINHAAELDEYEPREYVNAHSIIRFLTQAKSPGLRERLARCLTKHQVDWLFEIKVQQLADEFPHLHDALMSALVGH